MSDEHDWDHLLPPRRGEAITVDNLPAITPEGRAFVDGFAGAWAEAVAAEPPPGAIVRGTVHWFAGMGGYWAPGLVAEGDTEIDQPLDPTDPWSDAGTAADRDSGQPFELLKRPELAALEQAFVRALPQDPDDPSEMHEDFDDYAIRMTVAVELARALAPALRERGLPIAERYAILVHFNSGDRSREDFVALNPPHVRQLLADAGELPRF